jgi:hypothetical protein
MHYWTFEASVAHFVVGMHYYNFVQCDALLDFEVSVAHFVVVMHYYNFVQRDALLDFEVSIAHFVVVMHHRTETQPSTTTPYIFSNASLRNLSLGILTHIQYYTRYI